MTLAEFLDATAVIPVWIFSLIGLGLFFFGAFLGRISTQIK